MGRRGVLGLLVALALGPLRPAVGPRWRSAGTGERRPAVVMIRGGWRAGTWPAWAATADAGARIKVGAAWPPPVDLTALARSRGDGWASRLMGCTLSTCPDRLAEASPVTAPTGWCPCRRRSRWRRPG